MRSRGVVREPWLWSSVLAALAIALACGESAEERLVEIRALQDAGQHAACLEPLRELAEERPELAEVQYRLGLARVSLGQPSLAIFPLERAAVDPDYAVEAGLLLASTATALKGYDDAVRALDRVLAVEPEHVRALHLRANAQLRAGRKQAALLDASRALELAPGDYESLLLHATLLAQLGRIDEAEQEHGRLRATARGTPYEARACAAVATFHADSMGDAERAVREFRECVAEFPGDRLVLELASRLLDARGETEEADRHWREAAESEPDDPTRWLAYVRRLASRGDLASAEEVLRPIAEQRDAPALWLEIARLRQRRGATADALSAVETAVEAIRAGGGSISEEVRLLHADLYVDLPDAARALEIAADLEQPIYRRLIEGRVHLSEGRPEPALEAFLAALANWPNNLGARYGAGLAATLLDRFDVALEQLREAVRLDAGGTEAALLMAQIHASQRDFENALYFAGVHLARRDPRSRAAQRVALAAALELERYATARRLIEADCKRGASPAGCVAGRAALAGARGGPGSALESLRANDLDLRQPELREAFELLVRALLDAGRSTEALREVEAAAQQRPQDVWLRELRATLGGDDEEVVRAEVERLLAHDPLGARAMVALSRLRETEGDLDGAIRSSDAAAAADPFQAEHAYRAAKLALLAGRREQALARLREVVRVHPDHAGAHNDLAWLLAERGQEPDLALVLASRAVELDRSAALLDTLGYVHLARSEPVSAIEAFEQSLALRPEEPSTLYRLALAYKAEGKTDRSSELLERALARGEFPYAAQARRELAALRAP